MKLTTTTHVSVDGVMQGLGGQPPRPRRGQPVRGYTFVVAQAG